MLKLRVATLNVWGLPFDLAEDADARGRAIAATLPDLDFDVLAIQEAWTPELRTRLVRAGRAAGFTWVAAPEAPSGGLLVLSRVRIDGSRFDRFHFRGDPERITRGEYLGGKGFQTVELVTDQGSVLLINTHLHSRYRRDRPWINSSIRTAQVMQIVEAIDVDAPVVLVGDLNCEQGDPEYDVLVGLAGLTDAAHQLGNPLPTISRSNHYKRHRRHRDRRIDYVMVRPGRDRGLLPLSTTRFFDQPMDLGGVQRPVSDHFGVQVDLQLAAHESLFAGPRPDPRVFDLAESLLAAGRAEAEQNEGGHVRSAGTFAVLALGSDLLRRNQRLTRRQLLRRGLGVAAMAAVVPAAGYGALASLGGSEKRRAFAAAEATLSALRATVAVESIQDDDAGQVG